MKIILDLKFEICDPGKPGIRVRSSWPCANTFSLSAHGYEFQTGNGDKLKLELHTRKPLRCIAVKVVKVVVTKNRACNSLMLNGVKPSQGKSNQFVQRVKVAAQAAEFAGVEIQSLPPYHTQKTRVNTLKYAYARVNTGTEKEKISTGPAPNPFKFVMFRKGSCQDEV